MVLGFRIGRGRQGGNQFMGLEFGGDRKAFVFVWDGGRDFLWHLDGGMDGSTDGYLSPG